MPGKHNHYEVLNLPSSTTSHVVRPADIKAAYRRALLSHHPDKSGVMDTHQQQRAQPREASSAAASSKYTIDDIVLAYRILSDVSARRDHDQALRLEGGPFPPPMGGERMETTTVHQERHQPKQYSFEGLETVDLDDLDYDEEGGGAWYRGCRCGSVRGFRVTEEDLEKEVENGDVVVGCVGCSLWLRVTFQAATDG